MRIINFEFGEILVIFDRYYSIEEIKNAISAREGSYADKITERIHHSLLGGTRNLREEYKKYYEIEYESFANFLFWRYLVAKEVAEAIESSLTDTTYVGIGNDGLYLFEDESVEKMLNHIFSQLGETIHENSD